MAKKIRTILKVQAPAGAATAAPPVGPALGQHGINIMEFIKAFNERTSSPARLRGAGRDHGLRGPHPSPSSPRLRWPPRCSSAPPGWSRDRRSRTARRSARVSNAQLREIAETKMADLNANDVEHAMRIIAGTARSMGIEVAD